MHNTTTVLLKVNTQVVCKSNTVVLNFHLMKMTYGERLKAARLHKQWTQDELSEKSGVKQGTITKIERGDQHTSTFDIELSMALGVQPVWLKTGDERYAPYWLGLPENNIKEQEIESKSILRNIPIVGITQLGDNGFWCDMDFPVGFGDGFISFPSDDENAYALRCTGDSMRPYIKNGQFVIIEPNAPIHNGDEVLIKSHDGRVMIKTFLYERDSFYHLQSINEKHPSFSISRDEIAVIHSVAAVVKSTRWIKY